MPCLRVHHDYKESKEALEIWEAFSKTSANFKRLKDSLDIKSEVYQELDTTDNKDFRDAKLPP